MVFNLLDFVLSLSKNSDSLIIPKTKMKPLLKDKDYAW